MGRCFVFHSNRESQRKKYEPTAESVAPGLGVTARSFCLLGWTQNNPKEGTNPSSGVGNNKKGSKKAAKSKDKVACRRNTSQVKAKSETEMLFLQALTPLTAAAANTKPKSTSSTPSIHSSSAPSIRSSLPSDSSSPSSSSPSRSVPVSKPGALIYKQSRSLRHR